MLLAPNEGKLATDGQDILQAAGYKNCYGPRCNFFISPEAQQTVVDHPDGGYYTCPHCKHSYDLMEDLPWHGAPDESFVYEPGGGTRIGLSMVEQAQIGEDLIRDQGSLPSYGPITWWHDGGAAVSSPLDGATAQWGIEVKTIGFDATHHRFIPGRAVEKEAKNAAAERMGLMGILGVLVMLNYRTSKASVYVKEMPLAGWNDGMGRPRKGVAAFRTNTGQRLLEEIPFHNPFMDPHSGAPHAPTSPPSAAIPF